VALQDFLFGSAAQTQQLPLYNQEQMGALSQILQQALSGIKNPQAGFEPIAQQARTQFQTNTIPSLAERFTALGGGQRSSAFQGALGQAASGLEQGLAAQGAQYGLQNQGLLQNLLGMGLQRPFENIYQPRQPGFLENLGSTAAQGFRQGLGLWSTGSLGEGTGLAPLLQKIFGKTQKAAPQTSDQSMGILSLLQQLLGGNAQTPQPASVTPANPVPPKP